MDPPTPVDLVLQFGFKSIISGYSSKNSTKKGQALVEAGHVYKVAEFRIGNKSFITSQVVRQTSVNLTPYDVRLELNSNREAIIRLCSCAAGESSICKHISATIAYVNTHTGSSKTNEPQLWGKPSVLQSLRENYSHAKAVEDLYPVPKKMKLAIGLVKPADISATHLSGIPCALSYMLQAEERSIGDKIARSIVMDLAVEAVTFSVKRKSRQVLWQIVDLNFVSQIFGKSFYNLGLGAKHLKYFEKKIQVSPEDVINIAMETIDQSSNRKWMVERDCRVSASSKAHRIKIRKKDHDLLADQFLSPKPFKGNMATRYGNQMEKAALQQYEMILATAGIQVIECGLIIRESQPWLCASPDGIIVEDGIAAKILEIKCPFKCQNSVIIEEDGTPNVTYLVYKDGQINLKESHIYYTQVQMGMYVTGISECHFFVWSALQSVLITVKRNDGFLSKVVVKLEDFYFNHYLHKLICKQ